jgi:hypothetical protein
MDYRKKVKRKEIEKERRNTENVSFCLETAWSVYVAEVINANNKNWFMIEI